MFGQTYKFGTGLGPARSEIMEDLTAVTCIRGAEEHLSQGAMTPRIWVKASLSSNAAMELFWERNTGVYEGMKDEAGLLSFSAL